MSDPVLTAMRDAIQTDPGGRNGLHFFGLAWPSAIRA